MCQQTNENDIASCRYQELNPEMDAFLSEYLEDGRRKGLQESTIHLHDKIGHYFLSALTRIGCVKPQEMNPQNIGTVCLVSQQQVVSFPHPDISPVCLSVRSYRQGLQWYCPSF